ncbi:MAG TPA: FAD-dependent oxidoreductase [Thermoleophilaceae bacterium]|nr:FAD-dependent oxidoreductase [Thermoleophilaceae bacterium]
MARAVVVGAGAFGAALADRLVGDGWEVTLVDRFGPGHALAESGGETRLLRFSHGRDALYTRLARRARELWLELGEDLLVESGVVWLARREHGWEADSERVLLDEGIPVERVAPEDAPTLLPGLSGAGLAYVLHEPEAGVLRASRAVRALADRAAAGGARIELGEARPEGRAARLGARVLEGDAVVWACGAWLARLFPSLVSLRVTLQQLVLFQAGPEWAGPGWVDFHGPWYGHGAIPPHGFKVAFDADGPPVDPDERPREAGAEAVQSAREYLAERFPALAEAPVASAPACHYSLTPDSNFLFAAHPEQPGVWLLGGGSGHGFKHAPAVAEHVADVLAGRTLPEPRFALGDREPGRSLRTAGSEPSA